MKRADLKILLVDDDDNEIVFVRRAAEKSGAAVLVHGVHDGNEATQYLHGKGLYADRKLFPFPNVILCDLKMPQMDGFEFLDWLRRHPQCSIIPTVVFSNSCQEQDVQKAYRLGANSFIKKPSGLNELVELLRAMYEYWSWCEPPPLPSEF